MKINVQGLILFLTDWLCIPVRNEVLCWCCGMRCPKARRTLSLPFGKPQEGRVLSYGWDAGSSASRQDKSSGRTLKIVDMNKSPIGLCDRSMSASSFLFWATGGSFTMVIHPLITSPSQPECGRRLCGGGSFQLCHPVSPDLTALVLEPGIFPGLWWLV